MSTNNYINHIAMVLDGSGSMRSLEKQIVKVADAQIEYLAQRSKETDQETRVSLYVFENADKIACHVYDKDVLRLPSLKGLYKTSGNTPLIDATMKAIGDLGQTATLYGEHSFLVYVLTDGQENASLSRPEALNKQISSLPPEWTLACFVPNQVCKHDAKKFGFPNDNIAIWDADAKGIAEVGEVIRRTSDSFFTMRSKGVRGTRSLFTMDVGSLSKTVVAKSLNRLTASKYQRLKVDRDVRIDEFVQARTGRPYSIGSAYYQLTVPVKVQSGKQIAIYSKKDNSVYVGDDARRLMGLPDYEVKVNPAATPDFNIFIQSTSVNRKLLAGTELLII